MQLLNLLYPALLLTTTLAANTRSSTTVPKDAILLSKVKTLTLRNNAQTSHRRVPAVPQLSCKGPGCAYYKVDVMRCTNAGSGYGDEDIEWSCSASIPEDFKLGSTDVACEGYSSRDDPYVLKGSCGVEYRLLLTRKGEERYGKPGWGSGGSGSSDEWNWGSVIFVIIFVSIFAWIIYSACVAARPAAAPGARDPRRPGFFGGGWNPGGGGGGGGQGPPQDPFDPPPPYPGSKPYGSGQPQQAWRPGFWSGAGLGAGLGYMAGNRGREREPLFGQPQRGNNNGWFGGGNNNNHNNQGHYQPPNRSDSNGSSSSARHESTGFGSTSRR